jgi:lipoprotein-anchoring transpeptidase ErfK/SrfK
MVLKPIAPFSGNGTVVLITRRTVVEGVPWVEVLLPKRPNGTRGWIPQDVLKVSRTRVRVAIDLSERRLRVFRAGKRVMDARIAIGKPGTPTPVGRSFAIAERVDTNTPGGFLGPIVLPLTGFSETLNEFAGGDGRVAIHGTSLPALIGTRASHGCMRMYNADIRRLARLARPGTPVAIRP